MKPCSAKQLGSELSLCWGSQEIIRVHDLSLSDFPLLTRNCQTQKWTSSDFLSNSGSPSTPCLLPLPFLFFFFFFLNHGAAKILEFKSGFRTGGMNHIDTLFCFRQHPEQMRCFGVDISPTWTAVRFSWSSTRYHRVELLLRNEYNWCISIIKKNHCFCRANLVHWPWFRFSKVAFVMAAKIAC